jgi:hypothetical protein
VARTGLGLSASRSTMCSLTFENTFQGRRSSTRPVKRTLLFGGVVARPGESRRLLPRSVRRASPRGRSDDVDCGPRGSRRRAFGSLESNEEAPISQPPSMEAGLRVRRRLGWTLRRFGGEAQRPRGPFGDFARTPAGSSEPAERPSPRR